MPPVQLGPPTPTPSPVKPKFYTTIFTKKSWADEWEFQPYLYATRCTFGSGPTKSQATLLYKTGDIKREDQVTFTPYPELDLAGKFVKIEIIKNGDALKDMWFGLIPFDTANPDDGQTFQAFGLEQQLDRNPILNATVKQNGAEIVIGYLPDFNRRHQRGQLILGNRSTANGAKNFKLFSSDGEVWTNRQIVEYLLAYHSPVTMPLSLTGQPEILEHLTGVYQLEGMTLFQALNVLMDRRRGVGWNVIVDLESDVKINVWSVLDEKILGLIPENTNVVNPDISTDIEASEPEVVKDRARQFKRVTVRGAKLVSCFTVGTSLGNLEEAWTAAEETAYKDGAKNAAGYADGDTLLMNDLYRASKQFERVYRALRIKKGWDWKTAQNFSCAPYLSNGEPMADASQNVWEFDLSFLNWIPLYEGYDYSTNPPTQIAPTDSEPDVRRPLVWIKNDNGTYTAGDQLSAILEKTNISVDSSGREGLLMFRVPYNHYLGLNHFNVAPEGEAGKAGPEFDFDNVFATVAVETGWPISVTQTIDNDAPGEECLIEVPEAQCWYIAQGTIQNIGADGQPVKYVGNSFIRNDRPTLETLAGIAAKWYGKSRASLSWIRRTIDPQWRVGQLVKKFTTKARLGENGALATQEYYIGTPITCVTYNFMAGDSTFHCDFTELDVKGTYQSLNNKIPDQRALANAVIRQDQRIAKLEAAQSKTLTDASPDRGGTGVLLRNNSGEEVKAGYVVRVPGDATNGVLNCYKPNVDNGSNCFVLIQGGANGANVRGVKSGCVPVYHDGTVADGLGVASKSGSFQAKGLAGGKLGIPGPTISANVRKVFFSSSGGDGVARLFGPGTFIDNTTPDTATGTAEVDIEARKDDAGSERQILIPFYGGGQLPIGAGTVIDFKLLAKDLDAWFRDNNAAPKSNSAVFKIGLITSAFNPATVTWNWWAANGAWEEVGTLIYAKAEQVFDLGTNVDHLVHAHSYGITLRDDVSSTSATYGVIVWVENTPAGTPDEYGGYVYLFNNVSEYSY